MVVEIDGGYHQRQKDYDSLRTDVINYLGINVVRFTNEEVISNIKIVLEKLKTHLQN
jgi:very-short-patch-repair endonuclease